MNVKGQTDGREAYAEGAGRVDECINVVYRLRIWYDYFGVLSICLSLQLDASLDQIGLRVRPGATVNANHPRALQKWQEWQERPNSSIQEGTIMGSLLAQLGTANALLGASNTECHC